MGNTDGDSDTAAGRLQHLQRYYREHPVTGPLEGHTKVIHSGSPLSLATLDHVAASVREVADHTLRVNPAAGPAPTSAAVYDWARQHTEHADDIDRERGEVIEFRQRLEHAIRAGDWRPVIRPLFCPKCGCLGLMWSAQLERAVCTMRECVDRYGASNTFSLSNLATEYVARRKNLRSVSAT